jgi:hypothetical protein
MGRALLIAAALALLAACGGDPGPAVLAGDPHVRVTCQGCHNGPRAERGRAAVPAASCTAAGCHGDGGPEQVRLATATFAHRDHGATGPIVTGCAGCHTHDRGGEPLRASVDACAFCHVTQLAGTDPTDCRSCHQMPDHARLTSQGVPVAHSTLPWIETGCVRCHYDVAEPPVQVPMSRCAACHTDLERVTAAGIGDDLHPRHSGLTCTACHQAGAHRVRAISAAVTLVCADCHSRAHEQDLAALPGAAACVACHAGVHMPQQRLLLGIGFEERASPSLKFLAGITCRSCHVPGPGPAGATPVRGKAEACAGCHPAEYARVLDWWLTGVAQRERATFRYVSAGRRDLAGGPAAARDLLDQAEAMVRLVMEGGGHHNLELSDRLFRESIARTGQAYRVAGRTAPAAPAMGSRPHAGLCSYCHYSPDEPWDFGRMPERLHREFGR